MAMFMAGKLSEHRRIWYFQYRERFLQLISMLVCPMGVAFEWAEMSSGFVGSANATMDGFLQRK